MDENKLPQDIFRPMIAQSVQLEQFLGEELIFCFRDLERPYLYYLLWRYLQNSQRTAGLCPAFGIGVRSVGADWIPSCYL